MNPVEESVVAAVRLPAEVAVWAGDDATRDEIRRTAVASGLQVVACGDNVETVIAAWHGVIPTCVILAGPRPDKAIGEAAARIREESGAVPIVAVCRRAGAGEVERAIGFGVDGVVLEADVEEALAPAVAAVTSGQTCVPSDRRNEVAAKVLTMRERQILTLVATGLTNAEIAANLYLAESTVKSHLSSAFGKLNVGSRHEAATLILDPERGPSLGIVVPRPAAPAPA